MHIVRTEKEMTAKISKEQFLQQSAQWLRRVVILGENIMLMDGNKPVAEVHPVPQQPSLPVSRLHGTVLYQGDLITPTDADGYEPFK